MSDGNKVESTEPAASEEANDIVVPQSRGRRRLIIIGVILVVIAGAGIGAWIWHEQPSFCNAICHVPMDPFYETYLAESGAATVDKWDNPVSDGAAMLAATHREAGEGCLDCHVPTIGEMVSEGIHWVGGDYQFPLAERNLTNLTSARGLANDEFCLNDSCHHVSADGLVIDSRDTLEQATAGLALNPHTPQHGERDCGDCHKAHRASVNICSSSCHSNAVVPEGWLSADEADQLLRY